MDEELSGILHLTSEESAPSSSQKTAGSSEAVSRLELQLIAEIHLKASQAERYSNQLSALRKELNYVKATQWQYEPVDKLIGRQQQN